MESAPSISALSSDDIRALHSGQVILDLCSIVKELLENSLDAGARSVEVILSQYGARGVEVRDDGRGIAAADYAGVARKHHTSKLGAFRDLQSVSTFGFRGEALAALAHVARLVLTTRTEADDTGHRLEFDSAGEIVSQQMVSRLVGTTVQVTDVFHRLPVRQEEFVKHIKREYGKLLPIVQGYALICTNVKISLSNITPGGKRQLIFSTSGKGDTMENAVLIFGAKEAKGLDLVRAEFDELRMEGIMSNINSGLGRRSKDRQFCFVNQRPVDMPQVGKIVTECFRLSSANQGKFPTFVLNFTVTSDTLDLNVTPDKRTIFLSNEATLLDSVRTFVDDYYRTAAGEAVPIMSQAAAQTGPIPKRFASVAGSSGMARFGSSPAALSSPSASQSSSPVLSTVGAKSQSDPIIPSRAPALKQPSFESFGFGRTLAPAGGVGAGSGLRKSSPAKKNGKGIRGEAGDVVPEKPPSDGGNMFSAFSFGSRDGVGAATASDAAASNSNQLPQRSKRVYLDLSSSDDADLASDSSSGKKRSSISSPDVRDGPDDDGHHVDPRQVDNDLPVMQEDNVVDEPVLNSQVVYDSPRDALSPSMRQDGSPPHVGSQEKGERRSGSSDSVIEFDFEHLRHRFKRRKILSEMSSQPTDSQFPDGINAKEEDLLSSFKKVWFKELAIIGQFNNGFIIARYGTSDLFIIDQHASHEIFNFENLQKTTSLRAQRLIAPIVIPFQPDEEMEVAANLRVFERNGFLIDFDEEAPPGRKVRMVGRPESKDVLFGEDDVRELAALIHERGSTNMRPTRVRNMFASRACRMSIMIGDPLSMEQMQKVVRNLATLSAPWNCPHGRPTFRHLWHFDN